VIFFPLPADGDDLAWPGFPSAKAPSFPSGLGDVKKLRRNGFARLDRSVGRGQPGQTCWGRERGSLPLWDPARRGRRGGPETLGPRGPFEGWSTLPALATGWSGSYSGGPGSFSQHQVPIKRREGFALALLWPSSSSAAPAGLGRWCRRSGKFRFLGGVQRRREVDEKPSLEPRRRPFGGWAGRPGAVRNLCLTTEDPPASFCLQRLCAGTKSGFWGERAPPRQSTSSSRHGRRTIVQPRARTFAAENRRGPGVVDDCLKLSQSLLVPPPCFFGRGSLDALSSRSEVPFESIKRGFGERSWGPCRKAPGLARAAIAFGPASFFARGRTWGRRIAIISSRVVFELVMEKRERGGGKAQVARIFAICLNLS